MVLLHFFRLLILFIFLLACHDSMAMSDKKYQSIERIISLGPINTENLYLLGAGGKIVGNTTYCVRPEDAIKKPKVGSVMNFSLEKIIALKPDLILATGLTHARQIEILKNLGFRVVQFDQPRSLQESCADLLSLGRLLDLEGKAQEIIKGVWQRVEKIEKLTAGSKRQRVFLQIGTQPLHGAAADSFTNDFITLAGGINILGNQLSGKTNTERIIAEDPDFILIAIMGSETGIAGQEKKKWLNISGMKASEKRQVHIIDPNITCSPSPDTFVKTLELIAQIIHPGLRGK